MEWAHVAEIFGFKPGGLGYVESLSLVLTAQIAGALYLHAASRSVAPGFPRVLAALPVIASNLAAPLLFTRRRDETTIVLVAFNTAWLTR